MLTNHDLQAMVPALERQAREDGIQMLAVGAVIRIEDTFLIVTRSAQEEVFPNHAEIPGGGVDAGENLLQALKREILEETGLEVAAVHAYLGHMDFTLKEYGNRVRQFNFLVEPTHDRVALNPIEHSALEWLPISNPARLQELQMTELMRKTILEFLLLL
jgi:8-oxo-dGTP diphosphatase